VDYYDPMAVGTIVVSYSSLSGFLPGILILNSQQDTMIPAPGVTQIMSMPVFFTKICGLWYS